MSRSFRPVIENWGTSSSCFIDSDELEKLIESFASDDMSKAGKVETEDYGEVCSVWIEDGKKFLDYIANRTAEQHYEENSDLEFVEEDIKALLGNMVVLVSKWRESIDDDGSLTFYIDQY
jgi:hypothetical protein